MLNRLGWFCSKNLVTFINCYACGEKIYGSFRNMKYITYCCFNPPFAIKWFQFSFFPFPLLASLNHHLPQNLCVFLGIYIHRNNLGHCTYAAIHYCLICSLYTKCKHWSWKSSTGTFIISLCFFEIPTLLLSVSFLFAMFTESFLIMLI